MTADFRGKDVLMGADDLIPALLFIVCQSRLPQAFSVQSYIEIFQDKVEKYGQLC
jgi:hypothetical protein